MGWLVFNRPDAGNAMNAIMLEELEAAWLELDGDPAVAVIVNTGDGPRLPDRPGHGAAELGTRKRCESSRAGPSGPSFA